MPDKEEIRAVMELARNSRKTPDAQHGHADCCCPVFIEYYIFTDCLTINNGACPTWGFCGPDQANS